MVPLLPLSQALALAAAGASIACLALTLRCVGRRHSRPVVAASRPRPRPVTILVPLCGVDGGLDENLASFCTQAYDRYQVIFGVRDASDPAVAVARRVIDDHPGVDVQLVVDSRILGRNHKVSNLANMIGVARHDTLVIADSDMRVGPDYLAVVTAPLADPRVGAVTCLYRGVATGGLASKLGALLINEWFAPSVLLSLRFQRLCFCFGATIALTRHALEQIGGFAALAPYLADDHMLGKRLDEHGYEVVLSPYLVDNQVHEAGLRALFLHQLRWARTVRTVRPLGYTFSFVTYPLAITLLALAVSRGAPVAWGLVGCAVLLRIALHLVCRRRFAITAPTTPWLVPLLDLFGLTVWVASFCGRRVRWRDQTLAVERNGELTAKEPA